MKQVAQNYKSGELLLLDVPSPVCRPGGILVRTEYSLISAGTEKMKVAESKLSLAGKARARPDQVRKVIEAIPQQGLAATYRKAMGRLSSYTPLGYSLVGVVEEVGEGVAGTAVGDRVACAGDQYAHHAEFNWVPINLSVVVPGDVAVPHAAFTTVGSIAMQGLRQSEAALGETACVIGLGLVGQLLVRILLSAGLNVIGIDVSPDRCRLAERGGAEWCGTPSKEDRGDLTSVLDRLTDGAGADHVFLTASTSSNDPVTLAARIARDRARIVEIGKTKLDLPWNDYYEKELDIRFSRSYGPGRYDTRYEDDGVDYPIGYVRWTEKRNMQAFVDLLARSRVDLQPLISDVRPFADAVRVYEQLHDGTLDGLGVLFEYDQEPREDAKQLTDTKRRKPVAPRATDKVRLGVIGAGNHTTSMLLPHLAKDDRVELVWVAAASPLSAETAKDRFGFNHATTDYQAVLEDEHTDAVVIGTRHDSHAQITSDALGAGKATFVEKPLALDESQLSDVLNAIEATGNDRLMVGFNRRFSSVLQKLKDAWGSPAEPIAVDYVVRAGRLPGDSWYRDITAQGSRFVGEGGHFVDTCSWWIGSHPVEVVAFPLMDDQQSLECVVTYSDGSVARISYLAGDNRRFPKEVFSAHSRDRVARLSNFTRATLWSSGRKRLIRPQARRDKGFKAELDAFIQAVVAGTAMPIPLASLTDTSRVTFAAERSAARGTREAVNPGPQGPATEIASR